MQYMQLTEVGSIDLNVRQASLTIIYRPIQNSTAINFNLECAFSGKFTELQPVMMT